VGHGGVLHRGQRGGAPPPKTYSIDLIVLIAVEDTFDDNELEKRE
jgi:hypothetical protein